jgi:hypothetical protein
MVAAEVPVPVPVAGEEVSIQVEVEAVVVATAEARKAVLPEAAWAVHPAEAEVELPEVKEAAQVGIRVEVPEDLVAGLPPVDQAAPVAKEDREAVLLLAHHLAQAATAAAEAAEAVVAPRLPGVTAAAAQVQV